MSVICARNRHEVWHTNVTRLRGAWLGTLRPKQREPRQPGHRLALVLRREVAVVPLDHFRVSVPHQLTHDERRDAGLHEPRAERVAEAVRCHPLDPGALAGCAKIGARVRPRSQHGAETTLPRHAAKSGCELRVEIDRPIAGRVLRTWDADAHVREVDVGPVESRQRGKLGAGETGDSHEQLTVSNVLPVCGELAIGVQLIDDLATKLFDDLPEGAENYHARALAVRGLLFVRGAQDGLAAFLPESSHPSFRVHTFFRSIEGLYAPAVKGAGSLAPFGGSARSATIGGLTIDQKAKVRSGDRDLRVFDVLYCECCGTLFFGGMRAKGGERGSLHTELLPQEDNLAGLPDEAVSQRFEDLSWEDTSSSGQARGRGQPRR